MNIQDFLRTVYLSMEHYTDWDKMGRAVNRIELCNGTVYLLGNGASASIAAHTATDLTKMCKVPAMTFHDPNLMTCFVNDYGDKYWMRECVKQFTFADDLLILISSSGESQNVLYAADAALEKHMDVITLSGFKPNNKLRVCGDVNLWVNSDEYNVVEAVHWCWLAAIIDDIRGRNEEG